ncbi:MAG: 23S rRNA (uracil(1939)-C(5))-methyltransferase RlmD [Bacillota bacterium]|nr:23S rRNA (uracil(1939)-C(5))-methyltransferase RlmD [Bacillota bacterium]
MAKKLKTTKITEASYPNIGIGYWEEGSEQVYIKGAIKGQTVEYTLARKRLDHRDGKLYRVLEKSPLEDQVGCIHKDKCGGCVYQSLSYENEIKYKEEQIQRLFSALDIKISKVIDSPSYVAYRNKMEYSFGDEFIDGPLTLGMHKKNSFYDIINTDHCLIVHEDFNIIQRSLRTYFEKLGLDYLHKKTRQGNLRHLVVRRTDLGQILLNLVVTSDTKISKEDLVDFLLGLDLEGQIKSIFLTYNDSLADAIIPEKVEKLYGTDHIIEEMKGLKFKIGPFSFFQTNTKSAELLYDQALAMLENVEDKVIFDLYSGTGTISQILARKAKKVYGIEIVEEAVEAAKNSAAENTIDNVEFIAGDVLEKVDLLDEKPDIIVLDPPREGIHPKAIGKIISFGPKEFLYISCNPKTMVRDLEIFKEAGYKFVEGKMQNQFPRTSHVETIVLMAKE